MFGDDIQQRLGDSAHAFLHTVWPAIQHACGGGRIEPVEATTARRVQRDLDVLAGIDCWQYLDHLGVMRGLASRVQAPRNGKPFRSFTIRSSIPSGRDTELQKRLYAIENEYLYPILTVQAYVEQPLRTGRLLCAAVVRTRELFEFVVKHQDSLEERPAPTGERFHPIYWDDLRFFGIPVREAL